MQLTIPLVVATVTLFIIARLIRLFIRHDINGLRCLEERKSKDKILFTIAYIPDDLNEKATNEIAEKYFGNMDSRQENKNEQSLGMSKDKK